VFLKKEEGRKFSAFFVGVIRISLFTFFLTKSQKQECIRYSSWVKLHPTL